jgi:hypothetical protein
MKANGSLGSFLQKVGTLSALANTIGIALGLVMLALGLKKWAYVAWVSDTGASRSPLAFATVVQLPPDLVGQDRVRWWLLVTSPLPLKSCNEVQRSLTNDRLTSRVVVLTVDPGRNGTERCELKAENRRLTPELSNVAQGKPNPMNSDGFVLLDSRKRVVYGSYLLQDVSRLPGMLSLLRPLESDSL